MIRLEGAHQVYASARGEVAALAGVDLEVARGEFVCVRGPSGSGKSTLLMTLGAMQRPTRGRVEVAGADVYALSPRSRAAFRAEHVGFVFQLFHLVPYLDARANVLLAKGAKDVDVLLERVGLAQRAHHKPAELSAGERQRVAVARALANQPSILLADEPTGNLDPDSATAVLELLTEFQREGGTVVMVTHGGLADGRADRTLYLRDGRLELPVPS